MYGHDLGEIQLGLTQWLLFYSLWDQSVGLVVPPSSQCTPRRATDILYLIHTIQTSLYQIYQLSEECMNESQPFSLQNKSINCNVLAWKAETLESFI